MTFEYKMKTIFYNISIKKQLCVSIQSNPMPFNSMNSFLLEFHIEH